MSRKEFLDNLRIALVEAGVSPVQDIIDFYDENLNDRVDSGMSEEEAIASVESIEDIVKANVIEMPMTKVVKYKIKESHENAKSKGNGVLWIVLAILGSPIWIPLLITVASVLFALYVTLWSVVIAFFAVEFGIAAAAVGCLIAIFGIFTGATTFPGAMLLLGLALVLAGICILLWKPILALASLCVDLIKALFKGIKKMFVKN